MKAFGNGIKILGTCRELYRTLLFPSKISMTMALQFQ